MVPVEHLLLFSTVHNVMLSWMRPMVALTSKIFLSDEREEVEMPLYVNDDRPVRERKLYFRDVDTGTQMTKGTYGVGPTGDRLYGQRILDTWYMWCIWMNTQLWDTELLLGGSPCSRRLGDETGSINRNGQFKFDVDWLDGHPNWRGGSVITGTEATVAQYCRYIKGLPTKDGRLGQQCGIVRLYIHPYL